MENNYSIKVYLVLRHNSVLAVKLTKAAADACASEYDDAYVEKHVADKLI